MDQSLPSRQQGGAPQRGAPMGAFRANVGSRERVIVGGERDQFGRMRRRVRLSQSESSGAEEEWMSTSLEGAGSYGQSPVFQGMQSEGIWYQRSMYEQAESNYQRRLVSNGNGPLSSSPRSPNTRGYTTFQPRRSRASDYDHIATVKASGTPQRQYSKGRNRTSSETEQGSKGSRGPAQRKRGLSETEYRPRWDKYGTSHSGNGRDMMLCVSSDYLTPVVFSFCFIFLLFICLSAFFCLAFFSCANVCIVCICFDAKGLFSCFYWG